MHAAPDPAQHVLAHVFKVTVDPYVGKMGVFRVHQGTVTRTACSTSATAASRSRSATCSCCRARTTSRSRGRCRATSCAVAKVDEIHFDAVLHDAAEDDHIHLEPLDFPMPVHGLAIEPKRHGDEQRMWEILQQARRRGPVPEGRARRRAPTRRSSTASASCTCACCSSGCARSTRSRSTRGRRASPTARRSPRRPRATTGTRSRPAAPASSARCSCASSRCRAARGFEFVDQVKGGTIPGQFIPAVEKGVREVLATGAIAGYPVVDVRVHRLRRQAPQRRQQGHRVRHRRPQGVHRRRCAKARPIVLEPIVNVEITAPEHGDGRHHRRPGVAARPGQRHRQRRARRR